MSYLDQIPRPLVEHSFIRIDVLESFLFESDGVIVGPEIGLLKELRDRFVPTGGKRGAFKNQADRVRFDLLTRSRTLDHYAKGLNEKKLSPRISLDNLERLAQSPPSDDWLPVISWIQPDQAGFRFQIKPPQGRPFEIRFAEQDPRPLTKQLKPMGLRELFLALDRYRRADPDARTEQAREIAHALSRRIEQDVTRGKAESGRMLEDAAAEMKPQGLKFESYLKEQCQKDGMDALISFDSSDVPHIFFGENPPPEIKAAIEFVFKSLPEGIRRLIKINPPKIYLLDLNRSVREFLNANPDSNADTDTEAIIGVPGKNPRLILPYDRSFYGMARKLAHELGHVILRALDAQSCEPSYLEYFKQGFVRPLIRIHFENLQKEGEIRIRTKNPSVYAATKESEWFPEALADYFLGRLPEPSFVVPINLEDVEEGLEAGFVMRHRALLEKDPVGYAWFELFGMAAEGQSPFAMGDVFTTAGYRLAQASAQTKTSPDLALSNDVLKAEKVYRGLLERSKGMSRDGMLQVFEKILEQSPHLPVAQREYLLIAINAAIFEPEPKIPEGRLMTDFEELAVHTLPFDKDYINIMLDTLIGFDSRNFHLQGQKARFDGWLDKIVEERLRLYPWDRVVSRQWAQLRHRRGENRLAAKEWDRLAAMAYPHLRAPWMESVPFPPVFVPYLLDVAEYYEFLAIQAKRDKAPESEIMELNGRANGIWRKMPEFLLKLDPAEADLFHEISKRIPEPFLMENQAHWQALRQKAALIVKEIREASFLDPSNLSETASDLSKLYLLPDFDSLPLPNNSEYAKLFP